MRNKLLYSFVSCLLLITLFYQPSTTMASTGDKVVDIAKKYIGSPYSWGGTSPKGFDCSGFALFVYNQVGVSLPRMTNEQYQVGTPVARNDLQPGDMVFFQNTYRSGLSHSGIYVGNNNFIHASSSKGIIITSLSNSYWAPRWLGAKRIVEPKPPAIQTNSTNRLEGSTRYETAIEISKAGWSSGSETVVLASGTNFPDAIVGTPLAYQLDAPILLTQANSLNNSVRGEINRLGAKKVVILGGPVAISAQVETELKQMGLSVERIAGENRYETAAKISEKLNKGDAFFLATGTDFTDALTIASYAATKGYPILLTQPNQLPASTRNAIQNYQKAFVIGGTNAVSNTVVAQTPNGERIAGTNRFDTVSVAFHRFGNGTDNAMLATSANFADALTGSVLAAKRNAPLLLVEANRLPEEVRSTITTNNITNFTIFGGPVAVSQSIFQ